MDDKEWVLFIVGGLALLGGLGLAFLVVLQSGPVVPVSDGVWEWTDIHGETRTVRLVNRNVGRRVVRL